MFRFSPGRIAPLIAGVLGLMAFFSSSAFASGPPVVTIGATSEHSLNTAVVSGTVDKNGASNVTYKVEYGKTKSYGSTTPKVTVSTSGTLPISAIAYGLDPMTTYHARISATNSFGTTVSEDITFEMLLQWKVGGKTLAEAYAEEKEPHKNDGVVYEMVTNPPTLTLAGTTPGGTKVDISCEGGKFVKEMGKGAFGVRYEQRFINCKTLLNGTESKACAPKPIEMNLNGVMVPAKGTKFELGEECAIGTAIKLDEGGFEIGAMPEASTHPITLTEHVGPYTITESNQVWRPSVTSVWNSKTFGIL
jgi:hypothetical protein